MDQSARASRSEGVALSALSVALLSLAELVVPARGEEPMLTERPSAAVANTSESLLSLAIPAASREVEQKNRELDSGSLDLKPGNRPVRPRLFFGGGPPPREALELFAGWAGGEEAHVVAIGWGSRVPQEYFDDFNRALMQAGGRPAKKMPELSELGDDLGRAILIAKEATAIFLMGGDQARLIQALNSTGLSTHLRERLAEDSLVIAGTSAGTAVGSETMIGGNGKVPAHLADSALQHETFFMTKGIGLLPPQVILEQHCLRPGRLNRLESALSATPSASLGIGIDDGGCVVVTNDLTLHAIGPTKVHVVHKTGDGIVARGKVMEHGDSFGLEPSEIFVNAK